MQYMQKYAADLQSRLTTISGGLQGLKLAPNALGPIGLATIPSLNSSNDATVQQTNNASSTFGKVSEGIKATAETMKGTDKFSGDQIKKIDPNWNVKNLPGATGPTPAPIGNNNGPKVAPVTNVPGASGPTGGPVGNNGGPKVSQVTNVPGASGPGATGGKNTGGPNVGPIKNVPGAGGVNVPGGGKTPGGPNVGPIKDVPGATGPGGTGGSKTSGGPNVGPIRNVPGAGGVNVPGAKGVTGGPSVGPITNVPGATGAGGTGGGRTSGGPNVGPITNVPGATGAGGTGGGKNSGGPNVGPIKNVPGAGGVNAPGAKGATGGPSVSPVTNVPGASGANPPGGGSKGTGVPSAGPITSPPGATTGGPSSTRGGLTPGASTGVTTPPPGANQTTAPRTSGAPTGVPGATPPPVAGAPGAAPGAAGAAERSSRFTGGPGKGVFDAPKSPTADGTITKAPPTMSSTPPPAPKPTIGGPTPSPSVPSPGTPNTPSTSGPIAPPTGTPTTATPPTGTPSTGNPAVNTPSATPKPGVTPPVGTPTTGTPQAGAPPVAPPPTAGTPGATGPADRSSRFTAGPDKGVFDAPKPPTADGTITKAPPTTSSTPPPAPKPTPITPTATPDTSTAPPQTSPRPNTPQVSTPPVSTPPANQNTNTPAPTSTPTPTPQVKTPQTATPPTAPPPAGTTPTSPRPSTPPTNTPPVSTPPTNTPPVSTPPTNTPPTNTPSPGTPPKGSTQGTGSSSTSTPSTDAPSTTAPEVVGVVPIVTPPPTPPTTPKGPKRTEGERVLADEGWRHSDKGHDHPDASWTKHPNPVGTDRIDAVRDQVPPTRHVSESGGLTNDSRITVGPDGRPRFDLVTWGGDIGFDVRRIVFPGTDGKPDTIVQDRTFKLYIDNAADFTPDQIAEFQNNAKTGMDQIWNKGYQLPRGDQLNQHVEFTNDPAQATGHITITPAGSRPDLTHLPIDAKPEHFAHEIGGHASGLDDGYRETPGEGPRIFQHSDGKVVTHLDGTTEVVGTGRVTNDSGIMGPNAGRSDAQVMPRDLWTLDKRGPNPDFITPTPAPTTPSVTTPPTSTPPVGTPPTDTRSTDAPPVTTPPVTTPPTSAPPAGTKPTNTPTPERRAPGFPTPPSNPQASTSTAPPPGGPVTLDDIYDTYFDSDFDNDADSVTTIDSTPQSEIDADVDTNADHVITFNPETGFAEVANPGTTNPGTTDLGTTDVEAAPAPVIDPAPNPLSPDNAPIVTRNYTIVSDGSVPPFTLQSTRATLQPTGGFPAVLPVVQQTPVGKPYMSFSADGTIAVPVGGKGNFKEFYATPQAVVEANSRLREVGSKVTLEMVPGNKVRHGNSGAEVELVQVRPTFKSTPPGVCSEFSMGIIGGTHSQAVFRPTDPDALPTLGKIANGGPLQFQGTHELADALASAAHDPNASIDPDAVVNSMSASSVNNNPMPGKAYGSALRPGTDARARLDEAAKKLGVNQFAWARPGEAYVAQSVAAPAIGPDGRPEPNYGLNYARGDAEAGAQLPQVWGYHFGSVVIDSADSQSQITVETVRQGGLRKWELDQAINQNLNAHQHDLEAIRTQLQNDPAATDAQKRLVDQLITIRDTRATLADPSVTGGDRQMAEVELQNAELGARQSINSLSGKDNLPQPGQLWFINQYSRAEGETFFDKWGHVDTPDVQMQLANPLVAVTVANSGRADVSIPLPDARDLDVDAVARGEVDPPGAGMLTGLARTAVEAALWRQRNGLPLPEIHLEGYSNSRFRPDQNSRHRADVAAAFTRREVIRLLGELQQGLPPNEPRLTSHQIPIVVDPRGRDVPPGTTPDQSRRVHGEVVMPPTPSTTAPPAPVSSRPAPPTSTAPPTGTRSMTPPQPGTPPTNAPSTNTPNTNAPSTNAPNTDTPSTNAPTTDAPVTPRSKDVISDESWRHSRERTADWFAPEGRAEPSSWQGRREGAHVRTVDTEVADVRTDSTVTDLKSYLGIIKYDLRRIETDHGGWVKDFTVKVHLKPGDGIDAATIAQVRENAAKGVDRLLNQGNRLPSGDQFHVTLEFTDNPADAHTTIEVGNTDTDQLHWNPKASPEVLAHETLHYLGVPDEYQDSSRIFLNRADDGSQHSAVVTGDGGMMGADVHGTDPGLRPRHLWLVERAANSQVMVPDTRVNDTGPTIPPTTPPTSNAPTTNPPTSTAPTTNPPTSNAPTTNPPTSNAPTTNPPTSNAPTTNPPTSNAPTTNPPSTDTRQAPTSGKRRRDDSPPAAGPTADPTAAAPAVPKRSRGNDLPGFTEPGPSTAGPSTNAPTTDMELDQDPVANVTWDDDVNSMPAEGDVTMAEPDTQAEANALADGMAGLSLGNNTKYNGAFAGLANGKDVSLPTKQTYLADLSSSVNGHKPVAFVVNAIVGIDQVDALPDVVASIMANARGLDNRVAFVIGVNARADQQAELNAKLAELDGVIQDMDQPIALTGITFNPDDKGNFPYGTVRNETMASEANRFAVGALAANGNHPYLAVQDFDTGSRDVPSGKHIFNHVADSMSIGSKFEGDATTRPLMVSGGYRVGDQAALLAETKARLERELVKLNAQKDAAGADVDPKVQQRIDNLVKARPKLTEDFIADFARQVEHDMAARAEQSKTSPMLPYTPEPNLFIDAIPPMVDPAVRFGPGGTEFSELGRSLNKFYGEELGTVHNHEITRIGRSDADLKTKVDRYESQLSQLEVDAKTYRHPLRGTAFTSDFEGAAVETDLSRLALGYATSGQVPQTHAALANVANRYFASQGEKSGTSLAGFRDTFAKMDPANREPLRVEFATGPVPVGTPSAAAGWHPNDADVAAAVDKDLGVGRTTETSGKSGKTREVDHKLDRALQAEVPQRDLVVGIDQNNLTEKRVTGVNAAMSTPEGQVQRRFGAIADFLDSPRATPPAADGLFQAVADGKPGTDPGTLRAEVVQSLVDHGSSVAENKRVAKAVADFTLDNRAHPGDVWVAFVQPAPPAGPDTSGMVEIPGVDLWVNDNPDSAPNGGPEADFDARTRAEFDAEARAEAEADARARAESAANADKLAALAIATKLKTPITVHTPGQPDVTYQPLGKAPKKMPAAIHVQAHPNPNGRTTYSRYTPPAQAGPSTRRAPAPPGTPSTRPAPPTPSTRPAPSAPTTDTRSTNAPGTDAPSTPNADGQTTRDTRTTRGTRGTQPSPDADVQLPNAPSRSNRATPTAPIPLATLTPSAQTPVITTRNLPEFFQTSQALGSVAAVDVQGADRVTAAIDGLSDPDAARIRQAVEGEFESFLGQGRDFQVKIGNQWYEANVRATLLPPADQNAALTTPTTPTKLDLAVQSGTSSSTTNTLATANDVGLTATAGTPMGPYGSLGGKAQLATPATGVTSSTATTDQRTIRSGEGSTRAQVPVAFQVTLTDAAGRVRQSTPVSSDAAGPVGVTLRIPDDLTTIVDSNPTLEQNPDQPPADWGARVEHLVPEAVTDLDSHDLFNQVAAKLHPSVTKLGAPGRTTLRTFLGGTTVRDNLGAMLGGWVTSPDLVSPHAGKGAAVQMRAHLRSAELVGVHGDAQLRVHETTAFGTGVTATSKTGFDATGGLGANLGLPTAVNGQVGATLGYSARTADSSNAGTSTSNRTGMQLKGGTGMYKVTVDLEVRTPSGDNVTVPVTTYARLGLPEAAALNLPVPQGTRNTIATPTAQPRWAPPYLAGAFAAGNARVGEFEPANRVLPQVEGALRNAKGLEGLLPTWNDRTANPRSGKGKDFADVGAQLANQRKLNLLTPAALRSNMDSLLGPGVQVQLKHPGTTTNTYVNVTVKAKLRNTTHLGQADARNVRASSSSGPRLDSATATTKGWSGGVEGRVAVPRKTPIAAVTPTPQFGVKYNHSWGTKNTGGPAVNSTSLNAGSPDAQVFQGDVEFEVEITTFTRPRSWVRRVTPSFDWKPAAPTPRVVARTVGGPALDPANPDNPEILPLVHGRANLWVSDGSAMTADPSGFQPGTPRVRRLTDPPTVKELLTHRPATRAPEFLHVEAVANTTALRDAALDVLTRAADGDAALTVPGTESRNQVDRLFSPENIRANLRKLIETGMQEQGLKYDRRITDRTGSLGVSVQLGKPRLVSISDSTGTENAVTGGYKAGDSSSTNRSVDLTAGLNVPIKPVPAPVAAGEPTPAGGAGGFAVAGKVTPWSDSTSRAREVGGTVDRNVVTPSDGRTVLIQLDADVTITAESRAGNMWHGGTPHVEGAAVTLPKAVFVRVSEDVARELGVLPKVAPSVPAVFPGMAPPRTLAAGEPGSLGLSAVEDVPDLSGLVDDLIGQVNDRTAKRFGDPLVPDSVLKDSMNNLQRLVDFGSPTSVKAMIDSALDGGVPLLLHQPGTFGKDSFQVTLRAKPGTPRFDRVVNDGIDLEHTTAASDKLTDGTGRGTGWGVGLRAPGLAQPGSANPNVGGTAGVIAAANLNHARSTNVTDATTRQFAHLRAGSGPAAKYTVPIEFELVVERGDREVARATSGPKEIGVRLHADGLRVDGGAAATRPYSATATEPGPRAGQPAEARTWQQAPGATHLPATASVENLRGAKDLRDAAVRALVLAGANQGLVGKGTGPLNTLLSTISQENVQPNLPGMTDGALEVPGLHEAALLFGQDADVQVYARLVNPRLGALSDGVKLENPSSVVTTTSGEAKVSETPDVSVGLATGSAAVKQGPEPNDTVNFATGGVEVRHGAEDSQAVSGGATDNKVNNPKPQGRTGLVEFDVEYRVVAKVGGRVGVVDLSVPGSASARMPAPEAEALLGTPFPTGLAQAQDGVKAAAKAWRDAELEVDRVRHDAQRTVNEVAAELAKTDNALTDLTTRLTTGSDTDRDESAKVAGLETALGDARDEAARLRQDVADLKTRVTRLDFAAQNADEALDDATHEAGQSAATVADLETRLDEAADRLARAEQALRDAEPPAADAARAARDGLRTEVDGLTAELTGARERHDLDVRAREQAREAAARAHQDLTAIEEALTQAETDLETTRTTVDTVKEDLREQQRTAREAKAAHDRARAAHDALVLARQAQEARITAAEVALNEARAAADGAQLAWWGAKREVEAQVDTYNATPRPANSANTTAAASGSTPNTTTPTQPPGTTPNTTTPAQPPGTTPNTTAPAQPPGTTPNTTAPAQPPGTTPNTTAPAQPPSTTPNTTTPAQPPGTTPNQAPPVPQITVTPPNAPTTRSPEPTATTRPEAATRAARGPRPELTLDLPPGGTDLPSSVEALANDIAEQNAIRDRNGYTRPTVEVSGPNAHRVREALAARGVDAAVRDTDGPTTDVHVDWELKRAEGWTPPEAPVGERVTSTTIRSTEPAGPHPVLDDPSWRHSTAPTADWFGRDRPATSAAIEAARAATPVTSRVRGEDGGVLDTTTVGPDGVRMRAWRSPIAYDTRLLDVDGVPVRDFTVKIHLDAGHASPAELLDLKARTHEGVEALFNQGNRLPGGEQFHVTVEFTDDPAEAHATVDVTDPDGRANQLNWPVDADPRRLAHEVGHFLGLQDEYLETEGPRPIFQHQDGRGRVVGDNAPMTAGIDADDVSLKPRNLWLVENRMRALGSTLPVAPATADPGTPAPNAPKRGRVDSDADSDAGSDRGEGTSTRPPAKRFQNLALDDSDSELSELSDDLSDMEVDDQAPAAAQAPVTLTNPGGVHNDAFAALANGRTLTPVTSENYLAVTQHGIEGNQPPAFVVNIIVRAGELNRLDEVISGIMANAPADVRGRVAFVFGVNAARQNQVDDALAAAAPVVANRPEPVALVALPPHGGRFEFGATRNRTLTSNATEFATLAMAHNGAHPYVAVMDFDAGDRRVAAGPHVFQHVANLLEATDVDDNPRPLRPLMVGGGYRVTDRERLVADTLNHINTTKGVSAAKRREHRARLAEEGFVAEFEHEMAADMHARRNQAEVHPLLPYTPEPNLFVDGLAVLAGPNVRFGPKGAEFGILGRELNKLNAAELGALHAADVTAGEVSAADAAERLKVDGQNNRHPLRGQSFSVDFVDGATGTDLSRIAYGMISKPKVPQSHIEPANVIERFVKNKTAKAGMSPANQRRDLDANPYELSEPLRLPPGGRGTNTWAPDDRMRDQLGEDPDRNPFNPAISTPAPAPFEGVEVGVPQEHKLHASHGLVASDHVSEAARHLRFIANDLLPRLAGQPPAGPPPPPGTPPLLTPAPPAAGGLYDAVGQAVGIPPAVLREQVVATAQGVVPQVADHMVDRPMRRGHFYGALVESVNWSVKDQAEDTMAHNAQGLTGRLIATRLGVNLVIVVPGAPQPEVLVPFGPPVQQAVRVERVLVNGVVTYRRL
ncbi:hypothetical protein [Saccharothrix syringae]|uniref:hypothetical protein n=1 Tax=Saccharothrix syringae TaxID=103733 RepID=UPI0012931889|nr:hypothetical protein [Saccharothrix syringae]